MSQQQETLEVHYHLRSRMEWAPNSLVAIPIELLRVAARFRMSRRFLNEVPDRSATITRESQVVFGLNRKKGRP